MTQSHYWSRNQESDVRQTEPPRCPVDIAFLSDTLISNTTKNSVNLFFKYFKYTLFFNVYIFVYSADYHYNYLVKNNFDFVIYDSKFYMLICWAMVPRYLGVSVKVFLLDDIHI